jgi:hypothetical protein
MDFQASTLRAAPDMGFIVSKLETSLPPDHDPTR